LGILLSETPDKSPPRSREGKPMRDPNGKSPRRATRDPSGKLHRPLRDSAKAIPKLHRDGEPNKEFTKEEKLELFLPPELKANDERQQKIIDVWLKFSEIYANTIELVH